MLWKYRAAAIVLIIFAMYFFLPKPLRLVDQTPVWYINAPVNGSPDILNATLGFQQVFVINLPARTDRRDAMTLATALTNIDVTWIDGVSGDEISDKVLPADSSGKAISKGNKGSWRAHMNALQKVVHQNMTSALILEDDADWDVRLKSQLQVFAQAARAFSQPSTANAGKSLSEGNYYASTTHQQDLPLTQIPPITHPTLTSYGDNWDVLWLGHCGTDFPQPTNDANTNTPSHSPPPLRITIPNDATVPEPQHLKPHPFALQDPLATIYPPHTRVVHAASGTTCTQAYAVSQRGARKLLWQFGLQTFTTGWDLMLGKWCDGQYMTSTEAELASRPLKRPVCVTVQPPLFSHHYGKGAASDITSPGGGFIDKEKEMTPYVRLSVRLNMERLVGGAGLEELVDQWPDETMV
ncbi:hypothetical protein B0T22DRAFT_295012 [Podospora appendiculata]|uniref:Glycosyl transferase family 25 domain-containing protein n=1 Tax=Podospora appendiculata TaxID=314037 RepID=A0AAE1C8H3_9PEZI|nr:hypothetical protein B0T22DRAFT_295012 [Podospora appendiculata]